jgi:hypothetical protein
MISSWVGSEPHLACKTEKPFKGSSTPKGLFWTVRRSSTLPHLPFPPIIVNMANASCPSTGGQVNQYALSFVYLPVYLVEPRRIIRRRGTQLVAPTPFAWPRCCRADRLLLHPKVTRPDEAIATHRVVLTAASRGNVATDVIDPQQGWDIAPGVLERHHLHLLVEIDGLLHS